MSPRADKLSKWWALTWRERRILLQALLLLPAIAFGLHLRGLRGIRAVLAGTLAFSDAEAEATVDTLAQARVVARLVAAAARHGPYRAKCLPVSLTLAWLLQRQGITTNLRLGVRKVKAGLEAHAWVELGGTPLIDSPEIHERFVAFEPVIALRP